MDRMQHPAHNKSKEMLLFTALAAESHPAFVALSDLSLSPLFSGNFPRAASHVMKECSGRGGVFFYGYSYLSSARSQPDSWKGINLLQTKDATAWKCELNLLPRWAAINGVVICDVLTVMVSAFFKNLKL